MRLHKPTEIYNLPARKSSWETAKKTLNGLKLKTEIRKKKKEKAAETNNRITNKQNVVIVGDSITKNIIHSFKKSRGQVLLVSWSNYRGHTCLEAETTEDHSS